MIFFAILIITVILTWKYGDWRNWQKYQSTMLFFAFGNLLYNYVYHDKFLWEYVPDVLNSHMMEIIFTVTVLPFTALIFLSNYPYGDKKQILHILKFIFIYVGIEYFLYKTGDFEYSYGWNIWLSLVWNCLMFPILAMHHKKPLYAFLSGAVIFLIMSQIFPFNLD